MVCSLLVMPLIAPLLGLGLAGLGTSLIGGWMSAKASRQANERAVAEMKRQREENKRWYNKVMQEDYTGRADARVLIERQRQLLDNQYNKARGLQVVSNGTDESVAMQKALANKSMENTMQSIASAGERYKSNAEMLYKNLDNNISNQYIQSQYANANANAQAGGQLLGAGLNLASNALISSVGK